MGGRLRHNPQIDDDLAAVAKQTSAPIPSCLAGTCVLLDSWVYPANRAAGGDAVHSDALYGAVLWTRMNCARMLAGLNQQAQGNVEMPADLNAIRVALNPASADELIARSKAGGMNCLASTLCTRGLSESPASR